jgi:hypothetical protein
MDYTAYDKYDSWTDRLAGWLAGWLVLGDSVGTEWNLISFFVAASFTHTSLKKIKSGGFQIPAHRP